MARTRAFFAERGVLEVDTPLLGGGVVVEAAIDPVACGDGRFLLASPEGPMKRLLAAGSGPIYQFAHAFRAGEVGRRHASEFTMLEWYRPGFDHERLMDEVEALVKELLPGQAERGTRFVRTSYRTLFRERAGFDPAGASLETVHEACVRLGVPVPPGFFEGSVDDALDLLLVSSLEPGLGVPTPEFVHGYPPSQAALARVSRCGDDGEPVARRFELYVRGVELCNGYHELTDAAEQRRRFERANQEREARGAMSLPMDQALLRALEHGLPDCAGVALGFDRLVMLATGADSIGDVRDLPFA